MIDQSKSGIPLYCTLPLGRHWKHGHINLLAQRSFMPSYLSKEPHPNEFVEAPFSGAAGHPVLRWKKQLILFYLHCYSRYLPTCFLITHHLLTVVVNYSKIPKWKQTGAIWKLSGRTLISFTLCYLVFKICHFLLIAESSEDFHSANFVLSNFLLQGIFIPCFSKRNVNFQKNWKHFTIFPLWLWFGNKFLFAFS